jgi:hypothetical protein
MRAGTSVSDEVPNLEVMLGDTEKSLLVRHLSPLTRKDKELLTELARKHSFHLYTQSHGIDSITLLYSPTGFVTPTSAPAPPSRSPSSSSKSPSSTSSHNPFARYSNYLRPSATSAAAAPSAEPFSPLYYTLPKHDVKIHFSPTDFIQVNSEVNQMLVDQAIEFLQLTKKDNVLDLFCGLGNFTLPIARYAKSAIGVEVRPNISESGRGVCVM